jgi:hypothetical protein
MRKLLYVPIIHSSADLGSMAAQADKKGIAICGKEKWEAHKQTIAEFWDALFDFFKGLDPKGYKVYQDALVAEGELGMKIVEDGLNRGSKNYEIIKGLIDKGAVLVKTEDVETVKKEYAAIKALAQAHSFWARVKAYLKHILSKDRILRKRDAYIAAVIRRTLLAGETGILFIGAHHNIMDKLSPDIKVLELKNRASVLKYIKSYYFRSKEKELEELAEYLKKPISIPSLPNTF